jgi:23S rRNA pseudouridine2605 synthase
MSAAGVASRRKCEDIIKAGRVTVNGDVVISMGFLVDPTTDEVRLDDKLLRKQKPVVLLMNKPKGVITTMSDERGRKSVKDLLPKLDVSIKPIGRLDKDTQGLLLFTNDGDLAARLSHPKFGVEKTYRATIDGHITQSEAGRLAKGVWIPLSDDKKRGRKTAPAKIKVLGHDTKRDRTAVEVTLHEGMKRQVRLMFAAVGKNVLDLTRTRFGPLSLTKLQAGGCRMLSQVEIAKLRRAAGG